MVEAWLFSNAEYNSLLVFFYFGLESLNPFGLKCEYHMIWRCLVSVLLLQSIPVRNG